MLMRLCFGVVGLIAGVFAILFLEGDIKVALTVGTIVGTRSMLV